MQSQVEMMGLDFKFEAPILQVQIITYVIWYSIKQNIFAVYHTKQLDVATLFYSESSALQQVIMVFDLTM